MKSTILPVTNIQRFSTGDGPGIRTTVFLKGCPLDCKWCHNPETISCRQQIFYTRQNCIACGACINACARHAHFLDAEGNHMFDVKKCIGCLECAKVCPAKGIEPASSFLSAQDIMDIVMKDRAFYGENGGVTLSGGEPLLYIEGCLELLRMARQNGISAAIETSGYFEGSKIEKISALTDLFLWDFKDSDHRRHIENTGKSNRKILHNLFLADSFDTKILLRCILLKGINTDESHYNAIAGIYSQLKHCIGVELMPYHTYGGSKNEQLGYKDNGRMDWVPGADDLLSAKERLRSLGVTVK